MDGNGNGAADGPNNQVNPTKSEYPFNSKPADKSPYSDSVFWWYSVGTNIDLVAPLITRLMPPPVGGDYPAGRDRIPGNASVLATWSKPMSIFSIRTGGYNETAPDQGYADPDSTVVMRSYECEAKAPSSATNCDCNRLDPPGFFIDLTPATATVGGAEVDISKMRYVNTRPFYKANELGFSDKKIETCSAVGVPVFVPIVRAPIRDLKQNCFWPSYYRPASATDECAVGAAGEKSCCDKSVYADDSFLTGCKPH
jgi:hypothetical protein